MPECKRLMQSERIGVVGSGCFSVSALPVVCDVIAAFFGSSVERD